MDNQIVPTDQDINDAQAEIAAKAKEAQIITKARGTLFADSINNLPGVQPMKGDAEALKGIGEDTNFDADTASADAFEKFTNPLAHVEVGDNPLRITGAVDSGRMALELSDVVLNKVQVVTPASVAEPIPVKVVTPQLAVVGASS
jgi:hypothetical protein